MPAPKTTKEEQKQRDTITRMDVTIQDVVLPAIKRVEQAVTGLASKEYISRGEADAKYLTKADFRPFSVALGSIAGAVIIALVAAFMKVLLK